MKNKGFTLLEILLALFIFAIIAVVMANVLITVFKARDDTQEKANYLADLQLAVSLLQSDVGQAVLLSATTQSGDNRQGFNGTANSMTFTMGGVSNPFYIDDRSTLQHIQYQYTGGNLLRRTASLVNSNTSAERNVLSHITKLQFSYLDNHLQSKNAWSNVPNALPYAVEVTMTLDQWGTVNLLFPIPSASITTT